MTGTEHLAENLAAIADIDRLVHTPARLMILALLSVVEAADFTFLLQQTQLTRGNLSTHLTRLEEGGYIHIEKKFVDRIPRTLIGLTPEGRKAVDSYRENMKQIIDTLLT
ncbi:MAG: transcriptional regulator [Anaerolineales bacterium]|nr:transcriptional regulator [Anaerolineales bacterium]